VAIAAAEDATGVEEAISAVDVGIMIGQTGYDEQYNLPWGTL
jgi:hypothetical protein